MEFSFIFHFTILLLLIICNSFHCFSSNTETPLSPVAGNVTAANLSEMQYANNEIVVRYRCFQERAGWRFLLIPHVGVRVRTNFGREYFVENNAQGTMVTQTRSVNYGQWLATWEWQWPSQNVTLGHIISGTSRNYKVFEDDCYNARIAVLGMLRPNLSCNLQSNPLQSMWLECVILNDEWKKYYLMLTKMRMNRLIFLQN